MTYRHGGNLNRLAMESGRPVEEILDFSANINPLGPPEWLRSVISREVSSLVHYPDPDCTALVQAAAERYGVAADEVLVGNGSTEILYLLPRTLEAHRALIPVPAYVDYGVSAELAGLEIEKLFLKEQNGFALDIEELGSRLSGGELVYIGQPNNPTGLVMDSESLRELAKQNPSTTFVVDEAFADFVEGFDSLTVKRPGNVIVLCSLTKTFAVPGLRLGCAVADAGIVQRVRKLMPPWSVNSLAQAVGTAALADTEYVARSREFVRERRESLIGELSSISRLTVYPGQANFLLVGIGEDPISRFRDKAVPKQPASVLGEKLLKDGIAIRLCSNFDGLDDRFFRVAVRTAEENDRLVGSIRSAMGKASKSRTKRTPAIMFQGTSSNAGKSVLAAAMCRILLQDGFRVAPFKAQNMSLNSYVTRDGGEMGRAQVVQAQAARIDPDVRMNPVLLKPNTDTGSQVIVLGKPVGNMDFREYSDYKHLPFEAAKAAYDALASEYDVMVLEGAGSPGEVNLKSRDIVNMKMARYARSPVLLVGDIDRGGVYASFVGTMEVLAEWERALVAGFIVNRFRGIVDLLADAHTYVQRHTGRPVLGVVPYLRNLGLPEEDSVSFKDGLFDESNPGGECADVAVIDLPHISNFTDFDSLRIEPDVRLRIVRRTQDLGTPDAVILPGSKNVIGDLTYLKESGIGTRIAELAAKGKTDIIGVCGGFQILGNEIADPHAIESAGKTIKGLGLLPVSTVLAEEKTLTRVNARHVSSGLGVVGYEIHHGQTSGNGLGPAVVREDGEAIGAGTEDGLIWGTYLHGVFDADEFRRWFIDRLRVRKGMAAIGKVSATYDLEPAFERLAEVVRASLDMKEIYRVMGL